MAYDSPMASVPSRALRLGLAASVTVASLVLACSAEVPVQPTPVEAFCDAVAATRDKCAAACDEVIRADCTKIAGALHPGALAKATDCFLSGACSNVCLSKTLVDLTPTSGQTAIRSAYCTTCASGQSECETKFFESPRPSTVGGPGTQLLPFADEATKSVAADCASKEGCQLGFPACSLDSAKRALTGQLGQSSAECLVNGLRGQEGERRAPDGGAATVTCTSANCAGCCRDDLCLLGSTKDACGRGGAACETCSGTATCEEAACKLPCGPDTCGGCCDGNTCVEGTAASACGKGGAACTKCGSSFVCSDQTCIDTSCKATCQGCCSGSTCLGGTAANACGKSGNACVDCGKGRTCGAGGSGCTLDQAAPFDVVMVSAVIPPLNKAGGAWDTFGGLPDPYARAYSALSGVSHSGATAYVADTLTPQWGTVVLAQVPARELLNSFSVELMDDDYDFDDTIGGCAIKLDASMFDGALKTARCPATVSGVEFSVVFKLVAK